MKVRLGVQVFSSSTARALEYLRVNSCSEFSDSLPTETLLAKLDKLFDILNSRSCFGKGYKAAITYTNVSRRLAFLRECKDFFAAITGLDWTAPCEFQAAHVCSWSLCDY